MSNLEACFCHWKKGIWEFLSHNSNSFSHYRKLKSELWYNLAIQTSFFRIAWNKLAIVSYKVRIMGYKLAFVRNKVRIER